MQYVLPIEKIRRGLLPQAGRKTVQLSELMAADFHVPRGFCILASGYEAFVRKNALEEHLHSFFDRNPSTEDPVGPTLDADLRRLVRESTYPEVLREEILQAYRSLSKGKRESLRVAVRSSGFQEDGANASFAGQFDSYLNVRGEEDLLTQVKSCWASFCKTHCLHYQKDRVGSNGFSGVAVLVQEMIPARTAGVLFSANPISGSSRETVIEASWGLGEAIVGGIVNPDRFVVDTASRRVVKQSIPKKRVMVVLDRKRGAFTRQVSVPGAKQAVPCLSEREIQRLSEAGSNIQEHFGEPQDIEWAFYRNTLYILQSRPITTLPGPAGDPSPPSLGDPAGWRSELDTPTDRDTEWTSATIRELLPGTLSPLTISQMNALEYGFQKPSRDLGLLPQMEPPHHTKFLGFFYNRAHLNMTLINGLIRQVPLISPEHLKRILQADVPTPRSRPWLRWRFFRDVPNLFRIGFHALEMARRLEPAVESLLTTGLRQYEVERRRQMGHLSAKEQLAWMDEVQKRRAEIYAMHITVSQFGEVTFELLNRLIGRWARDTTGNLAAQFITGSSTPLLAKPFAELWGLAQQIRGSRKLQKYFSDPSVRATHRLLKKDEGRSVSRFREAFDTFLAHYGYRSRFGAELMHPSWQQEPLFVLSLVKLYAKLLLTLNPWDLKRERANRREQILRHLESHLNPVQKRVLKELIQLMQVLIPLRQNLRALSLMQAHLARRLARHLGGRLHKETVLREAKDIYFLTMEELYQAVDETPAGTDAAGLRLSLQQRVQGRRREYERNSHLVLPETFRGRPVPIDPDQAPAPENREKRLRGLPVSPGSVTGPARRIVGPHQEVNVEPGEILILPGMDLGWTPLFLAASAIVAERGGILSHGSILAREFGVPAVVSIPKVTRTIQTGQVITVDGDRGDVWL